MSPFKFEVDDVPEQDWKAVRAIREFLDEIKQPITNADRIRAMSDKELADFLGMSSICQRIQQEGTWCEDHGSCPDCLREWLKQPAEEGADHG